MFKPYETTYGSLINISKISDALTTYISLANIDELEFEYPTSGEVRCAFITGYALDERDLPVWDHPITVKTLKGVTVVVTDVRKYVTKIEEIPARLSDIVRDKNSLEFITLRALITRDFLDGNSGAHRNVYKPSATAMGAWISGMVGTMVLLDPVEAFNVEIISSVYANTLYYPREEVIDQLDTIIARVISSKHVYNISKKEVRTLCEGYLLTKSGGLTELIDNLSIVVPSKGDFITIDSLIGVMGNVWYGPGGSETPIMALENMATWMAILNSVIVNRSYAKSRIGTLLSKHSRVIDSKLVGKHFSNYLNELSV